jgi:hydroxypyruvate isomerase
VPTATEVADLVWSAHISWLFAELPYEERPRAARRAGFRCIESVWPQPDEREQLPARIAEEGLSVSLLNCAAGDLEAGDRGFINDPSRGDQAERSFADAAALASRIGAKTINVLVGRALPDLGLRRQREAAVLTLRSFGAEARARGLTVVVEPLNEMENPGYLASDPASARELIEDAGSESLGILFDVYHLARVGSDPLAAIDRHGDLIRHVQISDFPGRGEPGSGNLDLPAILARLRSCGYRGAIGLEYRPTAATLGSLAFTRSSEYPVAL